MTAAVGVVTIVCAGMLALGAAGSVRSAAPQTAASAFFPADGAADVLIDPGAMQQREHWVTRGAPPLLSMQTPPAAFVFDLLTDDEVSSRHWLMLRTRIEPGAQATSSQRGMDLYTDAEDGIRYLVSNDHATGFLFSPGLLVLEAEAAPGRSWRSEGVAHLTFVDPDGAVQQGGLNYRGDFTAQQPAHPDLLAQASAGCLEVGSTLALLSAEQTEPLLTIQDVTLWCPGAGIVASVSSDDGGVHWMLSRIAEDPALPPVTAATAPTRVEPARWSSRSGPVSLMHSGYGPTPRTLAPAMAPVILGDTLAVPLLNGAGLAFVREIDGAFQEVRLAAPGGQVTALGVVGDQLIVATAQRRLVAYRADGIRLWSTDLEDLVVTPPIAGSRGDILVATVGGIVRSLDASDGGVRWRVGVTGDAISHLARIGEGLVVADRAGGITALDADGAEQWSLGGTEPELVFATDDALYLARDLSIDRLDPVTGEIVWHRYLTEGADAAAVLGDVVVVLAWGAVIGLDAGTGAQLWRAAEADRLALVPGAVLVDGGDGPPRLLGADGTQIALWPDIPDGSLGSSRFLVADAGGVWIIDSITGAARIAP